MHLFNTLTAFATIITSTMAQSTPAPPQMTLIYHMEADLGERFSLGSIPTGQERIVIPIVGGTFKGPRISGEYFHYRHSILNNAKHVVFIVCYESFFLCPMTSHIPRNTHVP